MRYVVVVIISLLAGCSKSSGVEDSVKPIENYYMGLAEKDSAKYASAFDFEHLQFLGIDYGSEYSKAPEKQKEASRETFISTAFRENSTTTIDDAQKILHNLQKRVISDIEVEYNLPLSNNVDRVFVVKKSSNWNWLIVEVRLSK